MKKTICLVLILCIAVFAFAACGGNSQKSAAEGFWKLTSITGDAATSEEEIATLEEMGMAVIAEFRSDNSFHFTTFGQAVEGTYDAENVTVEGDVVAYAVDGDTLTMDMDGSSTMVFTRITADEAAPYLVADTAEDGEAEAEAEAQD